MVRIRRIELINPPGSGGGGGTPIIGNVAWGPNFGAEHSPGVTRAVGTLMDLDAIALAHIRGVAVHPQVTALSATYNDKTVGTTADLDSLAIADTKTVGTHANVDSIAIANTKNSGTTVTNPANAIANEKTIGVHLSGSALGAPFWLAVETASAISTAVTVPIPAGAAIGDLLVAFVARYVATGTTVNGITAAGWTNQTEVVRTIPDGFTVNMRFKCLTRVVDGTEGVSVSFGAASGDLQAEVHLVRGVNTTTPFNSGAAAFTAASDLDPDPESPSLTPTGTDFCLIFYALSHSHAALSQTHTTPSSAYVERTDFEHSNTLIFGFHTFSRIRPGGSATVAQTHNCTETVATDALMLTVAINPGVATLAP